MFELYTQYISPLNAAYLGKAQKATYTFSLLPEQLDFINRFFANQYIDECQRAITENSPLDEILILEVYRDTSPTWDTHYEVRLTATDRTGNMLPWTLIIVASLALLVYWLVVRPLLIQVIDILYGPPGGDGDREPGLGTELVKYIPWIVVGLGIVLLMGGQKEVKRAT